MKELELKDIVGYLPYKLKGFLGHNHNSNEIFEWIGINIDKNKLLWKDLESDFIIEAELQYCEIILRPMSDLTKPIKVEGYNEGKEFVPILEFGDFEEDKEYALFSDLSIYFKTDKGNWVSHSKLSLEDVQLLYQWHFDIHNLREKGLCVYYNEIEL